MPLWKEGKGSDTSSIRFSPNLGGWVRIPTILLIQNLVSEGWEKMKWTALLGTMLAWFWNFVSFLCYQFRKFMALQCNSFLIWFRLVVFLFVFLLFFPFSVISQKSLFFTKLFHLYGSLYSLPVTKFQHYMGTVIIHAKMWFLCETGKYEWPFYFVWS